MRKAKMKNTDHALLQGWQLEFPYTTSVNVRWNSFFKISICLPCDSDISFLGNYPREMKAYVHIKVVHECSHYFI